MVEGSIPSLIKGIGLSDLSLVCHLLEMRVTIGLCPRIERGASLRQDSRHLHHHGVYLSSCETHNARAILVH